MPRGTTTVILKGGAMDGQELPSAPTRMLSDEIRVFSGSGFTDEPNERVGIFTSALHLPPNWICYKSLLYRKAVTDSRKPGVLYEFVEDVMVDRCESMTKARERC